MIRRRRTAVHYLPGKQFSVMQTWMPIVTTEGSATMLQTKVGQNLENEAFFPTILCSLSEFHFHAVSS